MSENILSLPATPAYEALPSTPTHELLPDPLADLRARVQLARADLDAARDRKDRAFQAVNDQYRRKIEPLLIERANINAAYEHENEIHKKQCEQHSQKSRRVSTAELAKAKRKHDNELIWLNGHRDFNRYNFENAYWPYRKLQKLALEAEREYREACEKWRALDVELKRLEFASLHE